MRPISRSEKQKTLVEVTLRGFSVPGAGIEPARIAPLVFETSASTDSAIRAGVLFRLPVCVWLRVKRSLKPGLKESTEGLTFYLRNAKVS